MALTVLMGGATIREEGKTSFTNPEAVKELFETLLKEGVTYIDTARLYSGSEAAIGQQPLREKFTIDTKIKGGFAKGTATKDAVLEDAQNSLDLVGIKQFDVMYLHAPDDSIPVEETLAGLNAAYKKGIFRRLGLSNFTPKQVQEVYDVAKEKGYVLPTVYQGNYSPIARHLETIMFPTLRKLGIAFYAYSPLAGGFLVKTPADLDAGSGRFDSGSIYSNLYNKPPLRAALAEWNAVAEKEGVSKAELAYRWVAHNSFLDSEKGDAVIIGASKISQVEQTLGGLKKGSLSKEAVEKIEMIWQSVKAHAPVDNFGANVAA